MQLKGIMLTIDPALLLLLLFYSSSSSLRLVFGFWASRQKKNEKSEKKTPWVSYMQIHFAGTNPVEIWRIQSPIFFSLRAYFFKGVALAAQPLLSVDRHFLVGFDIQNGWVFVSSTYPTHFVVWSCWDLDDIILIFLHCESIFSFLQRCSSSSSRQPL